MESVISDNKALNIDINGQKGPNIVGRDLFSFFIDNVGSLYGFGGGSYHNTSCKNHIDTHVPLYCAGSVIDNGWEMKY